MDTDDQGLRDVVVVGGGAAGLSAALTSARARRRVTVVDAGEPRNAPAEGVHGLLALDGVSPSELLARGRAEVRGYDGEVIDGEVVDTRTAGHGFDVILRDGSVLPTRTLLIATGVSDELPDIPGVREQWGRGVLHCPYCHGWEVRDQRIGVLATSPMSVHQALLFRQWSADITLLTHTAALTADQREQLTARGVTLVDGEVTRVVTGADRLVGVRTTGPGLVRLDALVVAPRFTARTDLLVALDVAVEEVRMGDHVIGTRAVADLTGLTSAPGVWVAGNVTDVSAQLVHSAASGVTAAARINADLVEEETRLAVDAARTVRT